MATNLCLARFPLITWNTDVVEDTMQLGDNIIDLRGQVTRIDGHLCARMIIPREQGCCWLTKKRRSRRGRRCSKEWEGKEGDKKKRVCCFCISLQYQQKAPPPVKSSDGATQLRSSFYFCLFPCFLRMSRPPGSRQSTLRRRYGKRLVG